MKLRLSTILIVVAVNIGVLCGNDACAQDSPFGLHSLEWLVADADAVVRGIVADVANEEAKDGRMWNIVTLEVREVFKGAKAGYLKFTVRSPNLEFDQLNNSKSEALWILKDVSAHPREIYRNSMLERLNLNIELHVAWMPVIPLRANESEEGPQVPRILSSDLTPLKKTSGDILKAVRAAATGQRNGPVRVQSRPTADSRRKMVCSR